MTDTDLRGGSTSMVQDYHGSGPPWVDGSYRWRRKVRSDERDLSRDFPEMRPDLVGTETSVYISIRGWGCWFI